MPVGATAAVALNCSFPKSSRLRKRADYLAAQRGGKTLHTRYFVVVTAKQSASGATSPLPTGLRAAIDNAPRGQQRKSGRLGITVSKKVGNAVTRNRVKRVVREFARGASSAGSPSLQSWVPDNTDVVVIAKRAAADAPTATLWSTLESCRPQLQSESRSC